MKSIIQKLEERKEWLLKQHFTPFTERASEIELSIAIVKAGRDRDKIFHDHIKAHFEKENPEWKVVCKICNKSYDEIIGKETEK